MATVSKWNPFGVALDITATAGTVKRISATQYTVVINASWKTSYSGNKTMYCMDASSGGVTKTLYEYTGAASGSSGTDGSFTGTYSISGNGSSTQTITVTFKNYDLYGNGTIKTQKTKAVSFNVTVPAWTSYTISYNANGGSGAPANQTKWNGTALTLSSTKPTRTGYTFLGWATSSTATSATYSAGGSFTANANTTLYAVWKANTYTVTYNANGGTLGSVKTQTKTHDQALTLTGTATRTGYNFKGWATSATATAITYAAGASYTANAAVTLYAVWEIAYQKPSITNLAVNRCDANGNVRNDGTYLLYSFKWSCYENVTGISLNWASADNEVTGSQAITASGTSGTVSVIVGNGTITTEKTFTVNVVVTDSQTTTATRSIGSIKIPFEAVYDPETGEYGISFGKQAELTGVADFGYDAKFNNPVYGKALGMDRLPAIPANADFNDYLNPGCYAVQGNATAETCSNIPVARAGRLEVWSSTGEGVRSEQWSYLRQRFVPYNQSNAVWERDISRGENNVWTYYSWFKSSLTPDAANKVYNKSAITVCFADNIESLTTNAYTKVAFNKVLTTMGNKLSLNANSILIGPGVDFVKASAQMLLKCLTDGSKHFKINKVSGGTTTYYSWICQEADRYENASGTSQPTGLEFCMTPIIIPVKEGDVITCTYYTSNSTDYIVSGNSGSGYQSYMTVEEL